MTTPEKTPIPPADAWAALAHASAIVREAPDPVAGLRAIGEAMDRLIGSRMFTFLRFDLERFEMERLWCTQPERYPVGARKAMRRGPWAECVIDRGEVFIASGETEMRAIFSDHAALAGIGVTSSMCVPVRCAGRTLGTMNLNGVAGRYGPAEAALAWPFATLAVPAFVTLRGR